MKKLLAVVFTIILVGCGGSDDDNTESQEAEVVQPLSVNGVYTDFNELESSILVDTDVGVIINTDDGFITADKEHFTVDGLTLNATASETLDDGTYIYSITITVTSEDSAEYLATREKANSLTNDKETFSGTFKRQSTPLSLSQLSDFGKSILDDNVTYIIDNAGTITVNAMCTFSGEMVPNDFYYNLALTASGCGFEYSSLEGQEVTATVYTFSFNGQDYIAISGQTLQWVFWDYVIRY